MGVNRLFPWLLKNASQGLTNISLTELKRGPIAIKASQLLPKTFESRNDLGRVLKNLSLIKSHGFDPLIIFSGTNLSPERSKHREDSKVKQEKILERAKVIKELAESELESMSESMSMPESMPVSISISEDLAGGESEKKNLASESEDYFHQVEESESLLEDSKRLNYFGQSLSEDAKNKIIKILNEEGYTCIRGEAEDDFVIATLFKLGKINYFFGESSEVIVFGVDKVVRGLDAHLQDASKLLQLWELPIILDALKLTRGKFVDMCILAKTSYSTTGIDGIGIDRAYKKIKQHAKIETFLKKDKSSKKLNIKPHFLAEVVAARKIFESPNDKFATC